MSVGGGPDAAFWAQLGARAAPASRRLLQGGSPFQMLNIKFEFEIDAAPPRPQVIDLREENARLREQLRSLGVDSSRKSSASGEPPSAQGSGGTVGGPQSFPLA